MLKGVLFMLIKAKELVDLAVRRTKKASQCEQQVELGLSQAETG